MAKTLFAGGHDRSLEMLLDGQCDVAAVSSIQLMQWSSKRKAAKLLATFRIVSVSDPLPGFAVVMRHDIAPARQALIRKAMSALIEQTQKQGDTQPGQGGLAPARAEDYDIIEKALLSR